MAFVTSVMRVRQLLLSTVEDVLAPFELTFARFEILALLEFSRVGALPMGKVGDRLQVHPTSVSSAVSRLERQGFARREAHPTDGRTVLVTITKEGRRTVRAAAVVLNRDVFEALPLTAAEIGAGTAVLSALRANAGDF